MLDIWQFEFSAYKCLGTRLDDDLECAKCGCIGPVVIVQVRVPQIYDGMHDLCVLCVGELGLIW